MAQLEEVSIDQYKHLVSERALKGETMLLNMGPQHPSTHGVLRLLLELDGETIVNAIPDIGFLHTGIEKNMEAKTYLKAEVMTDRLDYMNTTGNNLAYCMAVEKLVDLDVPVRAQAIRVILTELQRRFRWQDRLANRHAVEKSAVGAAHVGHVPLAARWIEIGVNPAYALFAELNLAGFIAPDGDPRQIQPHVSDIAVPTRFVAFQTSAQHMAHANWCAGGQL